MSSPFFSVAPNQSPKFPHLAATVIAAGGPADSERVFDILAPPNNAAPCLAGIAEAITIVIGSAEFQRR